MVPIRQETIKVWYTKAQELKDLVGYVGFLAVKFRAASSFLWIGLGLLRIIMVSRFYRPFNRRLADLLRP